MGRTDTDSRVAYTQEHKTKTLTLRIIDVDSAQQEATVWLLSLQPSEGL